MPAAFARRPRSSGRAPAPGPTHEPSTTFGYGTEVTEAPSNGLSRGNHLPVSSFVRGEHVTRAPLHREEQMLTAKGPVRIIARPGNADPDREGLAAADCVVALGEAPTVAPLASPTDRIVGLLALGAAAGLVVYLFKANR